MESAPWYRMERYRKIREARQRLTYEDAIEVDLEDYH